MRAMCTSKPSFIDCCFCRCLCRLDPPLVFCKLQSPVTPHSIWIDEDLEVDIGLGNVENAEDQVNARSRRFPLPLDRNPLHLGPQSR